MNAGNGKTGRPIRFLCPSAFILISSDKDAALEAAMLRLAREEGDQRSVRHLVGYRLQTAILESTQRSRHSSRIAHGNVPKEPAVKYHYKSVKVEMT
jgi:hypothetical protein